jgi:hypothetical protein
MIRHFGVCFCLTLVTAAIPLRAATRPHAGTDSHKAPDTTKLLQAMTVFDLDSTWHQAE